MSFMSALGTPHKDSRSQTSPQTVIPLRRETESPSANSSMQNVAAPLRAIHTRPRAQTERSASRPISFVQTYQPPLMEISQDTPPELQPIFSYLNSHSNKLYQEGFFLKLNDLDLYGRPHPDRSWSECYAQLVGTILSLWDATALDNANRDGEVAPTFMNLADASIKMIETLPTRSPNVQPLQNVLSIQTAGKNRFLLHFKTLHEMTQWTAGIRLAMFEHTTLQEAYTGALIAGKGKNLNNIRYILQRTRLKTEEWVRVRFGAGTPWRRCWCVITPPDEKLVQKTLKAHKKRSAYDRSTLVFKGNIMFYDTKKIKKAHPIATVTNLFSAYAIYPHSKPLIEQSTLVKLEGTITLHSTPETVTEGFLFCMPEAHPGVSGFEMMLRWLFPVFDTFALYGRPNRLIADVLDPRGLMFAMPRERRHGYLENIDVAGLIHTEGSQNWAEREWRKRLKELTSRRMTIAQADLNPLGGRTGSNGSHRNSLPSHNGSIRFDDSPSGRSSLSTRRPPINGSSESMPVSALGKEIDVSGAPPPPPPHGLQGHQRAASDITAMNIPQHQRSVSSVHEYRSSRLSYETTSLSPSPEVSPPFPPTHGPLGSSHENEILHDGLEELPRSPEAEELQREIGPISPPEPVAAPPAFSHSGTKLKPLPYHSQELRQANNRMSTATLSQIVGAGNMTNTGGIAAAGAMAVWRDNSPQRDGGYRRDRSQRGVNDDTSGSGTSANHTFNAEGVVGSGNSLERMQQPPKATLTANGRSVSYTNSTLSISHTIENNSSTSIPRKGLPISAPRTPSPNAPPLTTSFSISRKPVPVNPIVEPEPSNPSTPKSTTTFGDIPAAAFDVEALERIGRAPTRSTDSSSAKYPLDDASNYGDDSDASPDYASTHKSTDTRKSVPRQRTGVLKTVGTPLPPKKEDIVIGDVRYGEDEEQSNNPDIPNIDFGPTFALDAARPPPAAKTAETTHERSKSGDLKEARSGRNSNRNSQHILTGRTTPTMGMRGHSRSPSAALGETGPARPSSQLAFTSSDPDRRRSVAWQPGSAMGGRTSPAPSRTLTPEEFVQQRATENKITPVYAHQRKVSNSPSVTRQASGEAPGQHSRQPSTQDIPKRPHSRGASATLGTMQNTRQMASHDSSGQHSRGASVGLGSSAPARYVRRQSYQDPQTPKPHSRNASANLSTPNLLDTSLDYSSHLSAREQEHVARMTGQPLISLATNADKQQVVDGSLVSAISAREREKREMREGLSNQLVKNAIAQRQRDSQNYQFPQQGSQAKIQQQQLQLQQQQQQQQYQSFGRATPQQGGWGQLQTQLQQNPQQWTSSGAQGHWGAMPPTGSYGQQAQQYQQPYVQQQYPSGAYMGNVQQGRY
ncbi:MAG: hypothetical protein M1834_002325 [Cirrosporium novae-zelandiae]|nr:MAG: hypothetical protein M1834_002325 [Cirrosporium novae-zelandiae]